MSRKRKYLLFFLAFVAIAIMDNVAARLADNYIRKNDYFFQERLEAENLNLLKIDRYTKKSCTIDRVFYLYPFQTYFKPYYSSKNPKDLGYYFIYS